ncbi:LEAF RUST 10 DISEASE-RESISTANCE LOCUS RECEPTOR-LIKE PROTEIN KINASE-like [Olea europaea subsp. europaea]|uniref:non-specific serine/threonine protein kinase n=1 Tax=Olea europaea subsp. europaea TaxID=158383 RepID=A0A8S0SD11_OLEEU|nr:LEAF RUST 10 DISEASE-RESISTANCE LOCUS RECEPTOR-LIKE PROTEIN KINASE-like [Olea europaea subsp. europaea]
MRYFQGFKNFTDCETFDVYYTDGNLLSTPDDCSAVPVPIYKQYDLNSLDFWNMFSDEYDLEWHLSDDCNECHNTGGQCTTNIRNQFECQKAAAEEKPKENGNGKGKGKGKSKLKPILIAGIPAATLALFFVILFPFIKRSCKGKTQNDKDIELFLKNHGDRAPRRYKYSDLKKMTNSFHDKLGEGGFAIVYRGKLQNDGLVAVKILKEAKGKGEEFINEVASISTTSHVNIVTLLGFCFEGSKRALIYDFMQNGSLDKFISNNNSLPEDQLGSEKLLEIAVGIARGIEYLHQGCNTRILRFDIKPHNILLDKDFNPKISDFGLAKLSPNRSSTVSMLGVRGTIGYIAPELVYRTIGEVSYKSDVYSYGMMVLEMVGETKNIDVNADQ